MTAARRGRLITVEGIEGAGKSTHIEAVCETLRARGIAVVATREPGGTPLGERLRDLLLADAGDGITAEAELLMMFAARAEHIEKVVRPALQAGRWVISDRFSDASYAYQGGGRGCDRILLDALDRGICGNVHPDLTFLLDIAPDKAAARVAARGARDRFENENLEFFTRVRQAYLARAQEETARWRVISAQADVAQVRAAIIAELQAFLDSNA